MFSIDERAPVISCTVILLFPFGEERPFGGVVIILIIQLFVMWDGSRENKRKCTRKMEL